MLPSGQGAMYDFNYIIHVEHVITFYRRLNMKSASRLETAMISLAPLRGYNFKAKLQLRTRCFDWYFTEVYNYSIPVGEPQQRASGHLHGLHCQRQPWFSSLTFWLQKQGQAQSISKVC